MTKKELNEIFDKCERTRMGIRIDLKMPFQEDPEVVINTYSSLQSKRSYYNKIYNENLVHNTNDKIQILAAYPIQVRHQPKRITIWD